MTPAQVTPACPDCGADVTDEIHDAIHALAGKWDADRRRKREAARKMRSLRKASRRCLQCTAPVVPGRVHCAKCLHRRAKAQKFVLRGEGRARIENPVDKAAAQLRRLEQKAAARAVGRT